MIKNMLLTAGLALFLGSCTVMHTAVVTNNPVGSKTGVATMKPFQKDGDVSYATAMKNGKISKIGIAELKMKVFILPTTKLTVTGE